MKSDRSEPNRKVATRGLQFKAKRETCQVFYKPISTFDTLANDYYCEPIVDDILGYLESYFVPIPPPGPPNFCGSKPHGYWDSLDVFSRCHIVDMNPFNEYFVANYPSIFNCTISCDKRTWRDGLLSGNITDNNMFIGLSFDLFLFDCYKYSLHLNYK